MQFIQCYKMYFIYFINSHLLLYYSLRYLNISKSVFYTEKNFADLLIIFYKSIITRKKSLVIIILSIKFKVINKIENSKSSNIKILSMMINIYNNHTSKPIEYSYCK